MLDLYAVKTQIDDMVADERRVQACDVPSWNGEDASNNVSWQFLRCSEKCSGQLVDGPMSLVSADAGASTFLPP